MTRADKAPLSRHIKVKIKENTSLKKDHYLLTFSVMENAPEPLPGQFYMISAATYDPGTLSPFAGGRATYDPLLKRPFSFFRKQGRGIQILYRIKGKGTNLIKELKKDSIIDVIGPLGNPYPMPSKKYIPLIVAGGIGIASLLPLITRLKGRASVIYGARTKDGLLMLKELKETVKELIICTDDGSYGQKATVVQILKGLPLSTNHLIYSCGPRQMLKALTVIALKEGINGYISLEENMACGLGACLGCAVMTVDGYKRVCKEGPVFNLKEIIW